MASSSRTPRRSVRAAAKSTVGKSTSASKSPSASGRAALARARPGGRSARVVNDVLGAAIRELAHLGYEALRVEDVATLAGVNKTTVYRRWPTKTDLVAAALRHSSMSLFFAADTGSVREDLIQMITTYAARGSRERDMAWRGIVRLIMADSHPPELARLIAMFRAEYRARWEVVVQRGVERGELPPSVSRTLIVELCSSVSSMRKLRNDEPLDAKAAAAIVDTVLAGARAGATNVSEGARHTRVTNGNGKLRKTVAKRARRSNG